MKNKKLRLTTAQIIDKAVEHLTCSTCLDIFTEPVTIKCGHTFCKRCISAWITKSKNCPECRKEIDPDLPIRNSALDYIANLFRSDSLLRAEEVELVAAASKVTDSSAKDSSLKASSASFYPSSSSSSSSSASSASSALADASASVTNSNVSVSLGAGAPPPSSAQVDAAPAQTNAPSAAEIREIFKIVKAILTENNNEATAIASLDWHVPNNLRHDKPLIDILREHPEIEICTCEHQHVTLANFEGDEDENEDDDSDDGNEELDDSEWDDEETENDAQIRRFVDHVMAVVFPNARLPIQLINDTLNSMNIPIPDSYGSISIDEAIAKSGHLTVSNRAASINWLTAKRNVADIAERMSLTSEGIPKIRSHLNMIYKPLDPLRDDEVVFAQIAENFLHDTAESMQISVIANGISRVDRPRTGRDFLHSLSRCLFDKAVLYRDEQWHIKKISIRQVKMLQSLSMWIFDQIKRAHRNRMDSYDEKIRWLLEFPLWRDLGIHRELNYDLSAIISAIQMVLYGLGMEKIKYNDDEDIIVLVGGSI